MNSFVGIWILVAAVCVSQINAEVLTITVLYETLCPDSMKFITKQLVPAYEELGKYIKIDLIPFGKSHYTIDPWTYHCQHGNSECQGNIMQACAIEKYKETEKRIKFVNCVMSNYESLDTGKKCAEKLAYPYDEVESCYRSDEGRVLISFLGDRTSNSVKGGLTYVPAVILNEKFNHEEQRSALRNLKELLCQKIEPTPSECEHKKV